MPNPYRSDILQTPSEKRDRYRLLMVGRGSQSKGHHIAISAVNRLRKLGVDVQLDIVGPSCEELPRNISGLTVLGLIEQKQLEIISARAGLLLVPSTHEGMPLVVLDALASGLPCLVSTTSEEFIGEGGRVVNSLEPTEWIDAIQSIIEDEEEWKRMCNNAPIAVQGLDSESDRFRWGRLYNSIIKSGP